MLHGQKKSQVFISNYSIPIAIFFITLLSFLFYFDTNVIQILTFLGMSISCIFIFFIVNFYISPLLFKKHILQFLVIFVVYCIVTVAYFYALFEIMIFQYPMPLSDFPIPSRYIMAFFLLICIFLFFAARSNFLIVKMNQIIEENSNYLEKANLIEINLLRQQMNPHFLFNALSNLNSLIRKGETQRAIQYNSEISLLLSNHLINLESNTNSLEEEIEWLSNYLQIEQRRLPNVFEYYIDVQQDDVYIERIPRMILQPIVENCITHGFSNYETNGMKGMITITVSVVNENTILITIVDNGLGINAPKQEDRIRKPISSYNIEKRIQLINELGFFRLRLNQKSDENGTVSELYISNNVDV
jgi:sensor histidine kinase YesM